MLISESIYSIQRALTCTGCTFGLYNISRFAILSVYFGGNFILQFFIVSLVFGIPLFWLYASMGSVFRNESQSMWQISPIFTGIGITAMIIQIIISMYLSVFIGWILIYLKEILMHTDNTFPWEVNEHGNTSVLLFYGDIVLQGCLAKSFRMDFISFQILMCLLCVWSAIYFRFYESTGKTLFFPAIITMLKFGCLIAIIIKFASFQNALTDLMKIDWSNMFIASSWLMASQEAFITWALCGSSIITIFSRPQINHLKNLRRDVIIVTGLTTVGLILSAIFANVCYNLLIDGASLMKQKTLDDQLFDHNFLGFVSSSPISLATQLFPETLSKISLNRISIPMSALGFVGFLALGLGQLYAMWIPIIHIFEPIYNAVFLSCLTASVISFLFATRHGLQIVLFLDQALSRSWLVPCVCLMQIITLFLFIGRPFSAESIVSKLCLPKKLTTILEFLWNVVCPLGLGTLAILQFQHTQAHKNTHHSPAVCVNDWPEWVRSMVRYAQLGILLFIPITVVSQGLRFKKYLPTVVRSTESTTNNATAPIDDQPSIGVQIRAITETPPVYTPPPSYSTATGVRLARAFRNTIRRSYRRIRAVKAKRKNEAIFNRSVADQTTISTERLTRCVSLNRRSRKTSSTSTANDLRRTKSFTNSINVDIDLHI